MTRHLLDSALDQILATAERDAAAFVALQSAPKYRNQRRAELSQDDVDREFADVFGCEDRFDEEN